MPSSLPLEKESLTGAQELHLAAKLARAYLSLWPAHPPAYYTAPATLGRAREEYADELQGSFLKWFGNRIAMRGKRVLDLGAGYGGRTVRYKELGAKHVVGLEISLPPTEEGNQFAQSRSADVSFLVGIGELLPFRQFIRHHLFLRCLRACGKTGSGACRMPARPSAAWNPLCS